MAGNGNNSDKPTATPGSAAYPWQLILVVLLFAAFIAVYVYFTSGEDSGVTTSGPDT